MSDELVFSLVEVRDVGLDVFVIEYGVSLLHWLLGVIKIIHK